MPYNEQIREKKRSKYQNMQGILLFLSKNCTFWSFLRAKTCFCPQILEATLRSSIRDVESPPKSNADSLTNSVCSADPCGSHTKF